MLVPLSADPKHVVKKKQKIEIISYTKNDGQKEKVFNILNTLKSDHIISKGKVSKTLAGITPFITVNGNRILGLKGIRDYVRDTNKKFL